MRTHQRDQCVRTELLVQNKTTRNVRSMQEKKRSQPQLSTWYENTGGNYCILRHVFEYFFVVSLWMIQWGGQPIRINMYYFIKIQNGTLMRKLGRLRHTLIRWIEAKMKISESIYAPMWRIFSTKNNILRNICVFKISGGGTDATDERGRFLLRPWGGQRAQNAARQLLLRERGWVPFAVKLVECTSIEAVYLPSWPHDARWAPLWVISLVWANFCDMNMHMGTHIILVRKLKKKLRWISGRPVVELLKLGLLRSCVWNWDPPCGEKASRENPASKCLNETSQILRRAEGSHRSDPRQKNIMRVNTD